MRNLLELFLLTLVITYDKEKMRIYIDTKESSERTMWHKHFTLKKLNAFMSRISQHLKVPQDASEGVTQERSELYQYYSKSVHNAFLRNLLNGPYGDPLGSDDDEILKSGLFGMGTKGSENLLYTLNHELCYFLMIFEMILKEVHNFEENLDNKTFEETYKLKRCALFANFNY